MIDTHAHLNFKAFKDKIPLIVQSAKFAGLKAIINAGSNYLTSQKAIEIAKDYDICWAAVGLHPIHVKDEEFNIDKYISLTKDNLEQIKAVGETGLDYFHSDKYKEEQKKVFIQHIELASQFDLPLILHSRGSKENSNDSYLDLFNILNELINKDKNNQKIRGVLHCFSSDPEVAQKFLDIGFYLGFDGPITFKNVEPKLLEVVKNTPLDRILIETDCPFLTPEPHRGQENQPTYVKFVLAKIAEIKLIDPKELEKILDQNAERLFKIT